MEKKLYTDTKTSYTNDKPVSECRFGNLRYGEPKTYKVPIEDFNTLYNMVGLSIRSRRTTETDD